MCGSENISGLSGFVTTTKHHDNDVTPLDVIHAPTRAKMLTHLKNARADIFNISEIAKHGLSQADMKSFFDQVVFQAVHPCVELRGGFDGVHVNIVTK